MSVVKRTVERDLSTMQKIGVLVREGKTSALGYTYHAQMVVLLLLLRNKLIANVFYLAGFIEAWSRGYEKIHDAFKAENLQMPVFEEVRGGFMATVKRERFLAIQKRLDIADDVTSNVSSDATSLSVVQLSERQKVICRLIKKDIRVSVKEMSLVLSLAERTVKRDLSAMQKMGVLVREGNTSEGHWVLLTDKTE
ncbi:MAG: DeoR family transcriptional regulator [Prevotella sp.]|nr:DeoR family transcriptional regulator [Prevotella sp.]